MRRPLALGLLSAALWAGSLAWGVKAGMHEILPEAIGRHSLSMAVAVSEMRFGLSGYLAYNTLIKLLSAPSVDRTMMRDPVRLNAMLAEAIAHPNPAAQGVYPLLRDDKGLVVYYKLAFAAFGYRIQSLYWLYFALLGASSLAYGLTFRGRPELLALLPIALGAHWAVMLAAPAIGLELATVHNPRFMAALGALPALHLALLILGKHRRSAPIVAAAALQTVLLTLVIHTRTGSISQVMFLTALFVTAAAWRLFSDRELGAQVFAVVRPWPLVLALGGVLLLKLHMATALAPMYTKITSTHLFWHPTYLGLGVLPVAQRRFGFRFGDDAAFAKGAELAKARFGSDFSVDYDYEIYELVLKDEYLRLVKSAPWLTVKNYLYKFPLFVKTLFEPPFGAGPRLPWLLALGLLAGFLAGPAPRGAWLGLAGTAAGCWLFSMIPAVLAIPDPYLIAEPGMLFLMSLMLAAAGVSNRWA